MSPKRLFFIFNAVIGLAAFLYVLIRVFTIPVTTDEFWTLSTFVESPIVSIVSAELPFANNHILNSLLTKLTTVFSKHEFFLRLPNLIACIVYIVSSYKISLHYSNNKLIRSAIYVTLLSNFTLLAFFGLCRGYGLSIAFMMLSISYMLNYIKSKKIRSLHLTYLFSVLAFYSNFTVLLAIVAIFSISTYYAVKSNGIKSLKIYATCTLFALLIGAYPLYRMYIKQELYYGGVDNYYDDTILSIFIDYWGYPFTQSHSYLITVYIILLGLSITAALLSKHENKKLLFGPIIILISVVIITNILFYTVGVRLPINRTSLHLYPLLTLSLLGSLIVVRRISHGVSHIIILFIAISSVYAFYNGHNYNDVRVWWHDMYTKEVINDAFNTTDKSSIKLFVQKEFYNSFCYYANYKDDPLFQLNDCCNELENIEDISSYDYYFIRETTSTTNLPYLRKIKSYHEDSTFVLYTNTKNHLVIKN